jgi:hypothetical protein
MGHGVGGHKMPTYDIYHLDDDGAVSHKFSATCADHSRAKIVAHAMKLPDCKQLEIWIDGIVVYRRLSDSDIQFITWRR